MVRFGYFSGAAKIGVALALALATGCAFAAVSISGTKHNLSSSSPNTIEALVGGTDSGQICVFCHTPHNANTSQPLPLWNKQLSVATYTTYTSDYLTALGYPGAAAFTPGQSSRVCLSCHDGTVAIGAVYNLNGTASPGIITMQNTAPGPSPVAGGMPNTVGTVGYLGTNLADDHPVGYEYKPGGAYPPVAGQITDPQLKSYATGPGLAGAVVRLDPDASTGKVECKSCHDPHKGDFGKFLRQTNVSGALCKVCHDKGDIAIPANSYDASGHNTSAQAFNKAGGDAPANRATVGAWSCIACHSPHTNPGVTSGTPILKRAEETTCYEKGCHGSNTTGLQNWGAGNTSQGSLDIQTEMSKTHAHPTNDAAKAGKHKDIPSGETQTQLGGIAATNRHAECFDCHNPHQVQPAVAKNTRGTLRISAALKGTWGVEPNPWPAAPVPANNAITFAAPAAFTKVNPATDEYQVCLKCHSNYVTLPAGARNIAAEINPRNSSYHGIVPLIGAPTLLNAATQQNNATNFYVNQNTMAQPWAGNAAFTAAQAEACRLDPTTAGCVAFAASRGRVWCSDCHNSDATPAYPSAKSATIPSGPHGSTNNGTGIGTSNSDKMLIATIVTLVNDQTPLCLRCHGQGAQVAYTAANVNSRNPLGRGHGGTYGLAEGCFGCHMHDATITNATAYTGTELIYPHGMNKKWAVAVGGIAATGQMTDSFIAGRQRLVNYSLRQCNPGTTAGGGCNTTRTY